MEARRHGLALVSLASLIVVVASCGGSVEPIPDGRIAFSWEISPRGCEAAGIETVAATLETGGRVVTRKYPCEKGRATVTELQPANYTLRLEGLDGSEVARFSGSRDDLTVYGGELKRGPHVRMTAKPGDLTVSWRFENGGVCGANNVDAVSLVVYDDDDFEIREATAGCSTGGMKLGDVAPGEVLVELRGDGAETDFAGFATSRVPRGDENEVEIALETVN